MPQGLKLIRTSRQALVFFAGLVLFALALRLWILDRGPVPELSPDARNYDLMVRQLLDRGIYGYMSAQPNAYVSPGYPFFLTALYGLFGWRDASPLAEVRAVQAVLGALTSGLVYLAGRQVHSHRAGWIAAVASAVYPPFLYMPLHLLTETLYTFLFMLYLPVQLRAVQSASPRTALAAGALLGAAVAVRPVAAPLVLLPWAVDRLFGRQALGPPGRRTVPLAAASLAGFVMVLLPWWLRNYFTLGKVILLAAQTGNPLVAGVMPYDRPLKMPPGGLPVEGQFDYALKLLAEGFSREPALYFKWFTLGKFMRIFGSPFVTPLPEAAQLAHYFIAPLGWAGTVWAALRRGPGRQVAGLAIALTVLHLGFIPENRYAYSILPLLMVAGGAMLAEVSKA